MQIMPIGAQTWSMPNTSVANLSAPLGYLMWRGSMPSPTLLGRYDHRTRVSSAPVAKALGLQRPHVLKVVLSRFRCAEVQAPV